MALINLKYDMKHNKLTCRVAQSSDCKSLQSILSDAVWRRVYDIKHESRKRIYVVKVENLVFLALFSHLFLGILYQSGV